MGDVLKRVLIAGIAMAMFAASMAARAQVLADPTRPPADLLAGAAVGGTQTSSALQSILLSKGRKIAVINGQSVPLGGRYGNATLVAISSGEVTLKSEQGVEVMKLYPGIGKTAPSSAPGKAVKGVAK